MLAASITVNIIFCLLVIHVYLIHGQKLLPKIQPCQRIVCYVTFNGMRRPGAGSLPPEKINARLCTHIIVGYTTIVNNTIQVLNAEDKNTLNRMNMLKTRHPLLEILVAVDGAKEISKLVESDNRRKRFVDSVIKFLRDNKLDGLDLALVNPTIVQGDESEKLKYSYLIKDLQRSFWEESMRTGKTKLVLAADVGANDGKSDKGYEVLAMSRYLDFVNIMTFNYHGNWDDYPGHNSPLFALDGFSIDATLTFWLQRGMLKGQINPALSTFGRSYDMRESGDNPPKIVGPGIGGPITRSPGFLAFYELCKAFKDEGEHYINNYEKAAYYRLDDLCITYDNADTFRYKIQYIRERGFGGIVLYTIDFDDISGHSCGMGPFPLTRIAHKACGTNI